MTAIAEALKIMRNSGAREAIALADFIDDIEPQDPALIYSSAEELLAWVLAVHSSAAKDVYDQERANE